MTIIEYILCGIGTVMILFAGLILHKIGTIRKWQIEEEKENF